MNWVTERADPIAKWTSSLTALLSIGCGGIALAHGNADLIAVLGTLGGLCSAIAVWATGTASKTRDDKLDVALKFSMTANERLDASHTSF